MVSSDSDDNGGVVEVITVANIHQSTNLNAARSVVSSDSDDNGGLMQMISVTDINRSSNWNVVASNFKAKR